MEEFEEFFAGDFLKGIKDDSSRREELIRGERIVIRRAHIADADFMHSVELHEENTPWVAGKESRLELKRIAIMEKGKGYGKEALHLAQKLAFEVFGTKYFYLGTKENNLRAQSIYKATGFIPNMPDPCTQFYMTEKEYRNPIIC